MSDRRPSRKKKRRERRAAERHGVSVEAFRAGVRTGQQSRPRRRGDPFALHEQWRQEVDR